ncbi:hypothetical protein JOM56_012481 [Amanita muscaria]|uniref:Secreted protein n=1 Tax=Amanita muscaria (strain Koide BX008) TaxID=946122 RepID=A0A0C2X6F0_AMAMK|nr:hypothetical protein M378DRAFT_162712 [Amanita muscaria Koide BX008]
MRFTIVFLLSSLLVPALASEPNRYGNLARYKGPDGDRYGVVLGSKPDKEGNHYLAPLVPPPAQRQKFTTFPAYKDQVVKAHGADISHTRYTKPAMANDVNNHHRQSPPSLLHAKGAAKGSPTYNAAETLANFHKSGQHSGGRWPGSRRRR